MLKSMIRIDLKGWRWRQEYTQPERIKLSAKSPASPGWYCVKLRTKNAAAIEFIRRKQSVRITQNSNHHGADLLIDNDRTLSLVFFRHTPLRHVSLHFTTSSNKQIEFSVSLGAISAPRAWQKMLATVSRRDRANQQPWDYIYRLTRARYKRAGREAALTKLIATYQPLLSYQTVSSDPYEYWCDQQEQAIFAKQISPAAAPQSLALRLVVKDSKVTSGQSRTERSIKQLKQSYPDVEFMLWQRFVENDGNVDPQHWYLFIEAGDIVSARAGELLAQTIQQNPKARAIYSDHDKIADGKFRIAPKFKPQWNTDFLFNQNYFGRALWLHGSVVNELKNNKLLHKLDHVRNLNAISLLLTDFNARSQAPAHELDTIVHIPLILLHQHDQSKIRYSESEKFVIEAAVQRYAEQTGDHVDTIQWRSSKLLKVNFKLPEEPPLVSLIIPTRDALAITKLCVNSILERTSYPNYEIIIVDNQSRQPETLAWFKVLSHNPRIRVVTYDEPFNYSSINNFAVEQARGEIIGLVNNDTEVINRDWLTEMVRHSVRKEVGCVGAKLYYFDNTVQHAGVILGIWGLAGHSHKHYHRNEPGHQQRLRTVQNLSAVTAACLLVRKSIYQEVGGLEEDLQVAFNDVDFCLKVLQHGYRNVFTPDAELYHYESKSRGKEDTPSKKAREQREIQYMRQKWPAIIAEDPCYNPNLSRLREDFSLDIDEALP